MLKSSFHQSFSEALTNADLDSSPLLQPAEGGDQSRRFDVYRNNRAVSLIEVLCSSYPAIDKLVGDDFFKASARAFIDANPPTQPVMAEYGEAFGEFISSLPNTENLPFLKDVAQVEWCKLQSYHSADSSVLQLSELSGLSPDSLLALQLNCHPALFCIESDWPVGSIWAISTDTTGASADAHSKVDMRKGETILITRPGIVVQVNTVDKAIAVFINAIQEGLSLGDAAENALEQDPLFNTGEHLSGLTSLGAFSALTPN